MTNNQFNVLFGAKADNYIKRIKTFNEIISYFNQTQECGKVSIPQYFFI